MSIGASTACFYPMKTELALKELAEQGIQTVEIFLNSDSELKMPFLEKLKEIQDEYGVKVASVHPFTSIFEAYMLFSDYQRRYQDTLVYYQKYFRAANYLDAKFVVLHGGYRKLNIPDEIYLERLSALMETGKRQGVVLAHENVNLHHCADPETVRLIKNALPDMRFVLDVKQAVRAGISPYEMLAAMGNAVGHVHLSDHNDRESCLLPGKGRFDYKKLFLQLNTVGYEGEYVVEVYQSACRQLSELGESVKYLQTIYDDIKN